ncbi:MAG: DUF4388 domain-containing protein [Gemmatimonas sp.]
MSLEGNLRDLALPEVCQLLAVTRKSGELRLKAPLAGLNAHILFESGAIVGAGIRGMAIPAALDTETSTQDAAQAVERTTLELLCWNDGEFRFVPDNDSASSLRTGVRLHTELLLMEGARRSEEWDHLSDRIPNARAVPAFVDVEPRQLPLLNLQPQQWEVLTGVDGQRDLSVLARSLGRDLLEVAEIVHGLIGTGLLKLAEVSRVQRAQATPPSSVAQSGRAGVDLWVPAMHEDAPDALDDDADDEIFDPIRVGVITPDGLPRLRTPLQVSRVAASRSPQKDVVECASAEGLRKRGDSAARRGDFTEALSFWNAVLALNCDRDVATREQILLDQAHAIAAIDLATRLQMLLHVNQPV